MECRVLTSSDPDFARCAAIRMEVFVKEQRVRCLLQGAWFPTGLWEADGPFKKTDPQSSAISSLRASAFATPTLLR